MTDTVTVGHPRTPVSSWLMATSSLIAAFWLGVLTEWAQGVLRDPFAMLANSVAWWVVVAFAAGALVRRRAAAVATGIGVELLLVAGYYVARTVGGVPSAPATLLVWLGAAVVGGAAFGLAGSWWREGATWQRVVALATLGGAFVSEGAVRWVSMPWQGATGAVQVAVGVTVTIGLARGWRQRLLVAGALAVATGLGFVGTWAVNELLAAEV
ncbi:DUF6518 family protein [Myceligenerans pegani]|uniref:Uncharacterized protein n=1 Tax=Myceligenerans pegani TaxID=2776917 RepID=A0ABR9N554_9MICO|nr:DUF6518 family protein [Myceligenerans sp. TRM 65318]MBE1878794.1 hypothetical protein [Myceligenerans sp. TRM 65318]MBE3021065.1 hypothetical protein [Myceligenerans sp. TRM 65318]